jgi:hypothetical protein
MLMLDSDFTTTTTTRLHLEVENVTLAFWYLLFVLGGAGDVLILCVLSVGLHVAMRVYESGVLTLPFVQLVARAAWASCWANTLATTRRGTLQIHEPWFDSGICNFMTTMDNSARAILG